MKNAILSQLGIHEQNKGAAVGAVWQSQLNSVDDIVSINPADESMIASVSPCSHVDYEVIIQKLLIAQNAWRCVPAPKRGDIIRQIGQALREHKDLLGSLVSMEMGKSKQEGDGEVQEMIDIADFAVGQSRMMYGKTMHSERPDHRMYEHWHPYGIVGIITAFNFPVAVWAWNAFIAAVCGNVCLWKPSPKTPLCAIAVHQLCARVLAKNACPDIFAYMIPSDQQTLDNMVDDRRIPLISFTGSTPVGKIVAERVAARLGRSILELGGNNAIIADETADLELVIPAVVFGAVGTAGQRCTTTRRLFVHDSHFDAVLKRLVNAYEQISIGSPLNPANLMGPLIDENAVKQFEKAITSIKSEGGTIIYGGARLSQKGFYVQPTVVSGLTADSRLVQHETFAPILYLLRFHDFEKVLQEHNAVAQGLSSSLFTTDLRRAELFLSARGSDCGIANINIGTSGAEIGGAFGGEKDTGGGREAGSDSWKAYMRRQTTTINWSTQLPLAQGIRFSTE